ncbi:MAG TPA: 23S rRNA (uracil(1939)-C(5))-methyltransferase RlmD [Steroidobacteraceae bacterium]
MRGKVNRDAVEELGSVAALTHEGEGVVRGTQGTEPGKPGTKTVFVAGALPGESIRFKRVRRHRQHDEGQLLEVLTASSDRVTPKCVHFGVCGGCALQHLSPEVQIAAKDAEVRSNFERVARIEPDTWLEPMRGPVWGYRRRARLGAKYVIKKGRGVVGFRERLAPYVAELTRCEVLAPPVDGLITPLAELLGDLSIRERLPQIEVAVADNVTALVLRVLEPPTGDDLDKLRRFGAAHGVQFYLQPGGLDTVRALEGKVDPLLYRLPRFNLEMEFLPTDFIQINGAINETLVSRAVDLLGLTADSQVLDLFCGLGNFTLPLARVAGRVVGVEGDRALVERARHNARRNGLTNAEFHVADLFKPFAVPGGPGRGGGQAGESPGPAPPWATGVSYTHILLDPPRAGAREILPYVATLRPQAVLYVSCHPGSLARDVGVLVHEFGFAVRAAGVIDMFPHTGHVESLAVLTPGRPKR